MSATFLNLKGIIGPSGKPNGIRTGTGKNLGNNKIFKTKTKQSGKHSGRVNLTNPNKRVMGSTSRKSPTPQGGNKSQIIDHTGPKVIGGK